MGGHCLAEEHFTPPMCETPGAAKRYPEQGRGGLFLSLFHLKEKTTWGSVQLAKRAKGKGDAARARDARR